ncbi:MAG: Porphobilinogen synthase, partial [uncultured Gemmatimonadaceae bacterium]
ARARGALARARRRRRGGAERHDGRARGGDPRRARRRRVQRDAGAELRGEVRVGLLRAVPRGGRERARAWRPPRLPDGRGQRRRGAPRGVARHRGGGRHDHGEARGRVPRRRAAREGRDRVPGGRVPGERRVRYDSRGRRARVDRPRARDDGVAGGDPARGGGLHAHVLRDGGGDAAPSRVGRM